MKGVYKMPRVKKNIVVAGIISLSIIILFYTCAPPHKAKVDTYKSALADFQNPPAEYSTAPFWVWNYIITKPMIDEQLRLYKDIGVNQVIIHPRPGLVTEYLSPKWFDLIKYAVDVAKKLGMKILLYDENSYPSGFAGGHVPSEMSEVMIRYLMLTKTTRPDTVADKFLILRRKGSEFSAVDSASLMKDTLYYVTYFQKASKDPWFAGFTYVDILQKKTTEKFLELTHEKYKNAIGDEFGKTVLGIFTDEPSPDFSQLPYTPGLFERFQKEYGYDLKTKLPLLLEELGDYKKVRHDTYRLLLDLFVEGWAKPYSDWCSKNNLPMTGHYWEHAWPYQAACPDNMALNSYSQIPGIDVLCNNFRNAMGGQFGNDLMVRETKSVANQMGRERLLSETYGAAGWDLTFRDMKRIGDWEYALGVNLMNQHLTWGSITGYRKYDHPPSFSYHAPYFKDYKLLADYYSRLSAALSKGIQYNRILLLEPTTSVRLYWKNYVEGYDSKFVDSIMMRCVNAFHKITHDFESAQVEYDIGSEYLIREYGKVKGNELLINKGRYDLFIIPPFTENLESETVELLESFLKNGGKVISTRVLPLYVDGIESDKVKNLSEKFIQNWSVADSITPSDIRRFSKTPITFGIKQGSDRLYHIRKELSDCQLIFLANASDSLDSRGSFTINGRGAEVWDLFTGNVSSYPFSTDGDKLSVGFDLPPSGSLLLCLRDQASGVAAYTQESLGESLPFTDKVEITRKVPNMLTIDFCDLRLKEEKFNNLYFYDAQKKIFNAHGMESNPWRGIQFKKEILEKNKFDENSGFEADYKFIVDKGVDISTLRAAYERPEIFKIKINGKQIEPIVGKWFIDKDFAVYDISKFVNIGVNTLTVVSRPMNVLSELDRGYILGNFSLQPISRGFKLTPEKKLEIGDWTKQGMQMYSDKIAYEHTMDISKKNASYIVALQEWRGSCAEVYVNDQLAGIIAFDPFELDVTRYLIDGKNKISVNVVGTLRNLLGPHHTKDAVGQTWPSMFFGVDTAKGCTLAGDSYVLMPYGLMKDFRLIAR